MGTRNTLASLLVACVALTSGCRFDFEKDNFVENLCTTDASCGPEAHCDTERGMCVASESDAVQVALEVVPPASSDSSGAVFSVPAFSLERTSVLDIDIAPPAKVWGRVHWAGNGGTANIAAVISIVPSSTIAGHQPAPIQTQRSTAGLGVNIPDVAFAAAVASREGAPIPFDVIITPIAEAARDLPPRRVHNAQTRPAADGTFEVINLDYPTDLVEIVGDVVDSLTSAPLPGLIVQAVDAETNQVVSSTAVTEPLGNESPGRFLIRLAPGASNYFLRISSGDSELNPMPALTVWPDYLALSEDGVALVGVNNTRTFTFSATVESELSHLPIENALVQFRLRAELTAEGIFATAPVHTDSTGKFFVQLVNGDYDVIITPPNDAIDGHDLLGMTVETRHIQVAEGMHSIMGQVFEVPTRVLMAGGVLTSDGRALSGAIVEATALGRPLGNIAPASAFNRSNQVLTREDGSYSLALDLGVYDVTLKPPAESGFPWMVIADFEVSPAGDSRRISSSAPHPVTGIVRDPFGDPVPGALIRAYAIIPNGSVQRSVQIGSAVSASDGSYMLLLPPEVL